MNQMEKLVTKYLHRHTSLQISGNCNTIYCALDEYSRQGRGNLQTCSLCCKALPTVDERHQQLHDLTVEQSDHMV